MRRDPRVCLASAAGSTSPLRVHAQTSASLLSSLSQPLFTPIKPPSTAPFAFDRLPKDDFSQLLPFNLAKRNRLNLLPASRASFLRGSLRPRVKYARSSPSRKPSNNLTKSRRRPPIFATFHSSDSLIASACGLTCSHLHKRALSSPHTYQQTDILTKTHIYHHVQQARSESRGDPERFAQVCWWTSS